MADTVALGREGIMRASAPVIRDRLLIWLLLVAYLLPQLMAQVRQRHRKPPWDRLRVIIFREWQEPPTCSG